ncbi:PAS domain-containing hybrid sensor histidine kinase/response regulator [Thetidibacter halocola]|uniref:histidine kinase n=1 Tax=Thetidibacter halocola TaxID=2827239 RepID=A0A8J7WHT5_9RHOB|nr:PAS domain-containing protein [Thetidibacter halocola]MBS0125368.1 PAS domain-containing protein [Thetidibacter halocola]
MNETIELQMLRAASRASRTGAWRWYLSDDRVVWTEVTHTLFEVPPGTHIDLELALSFYEAESLERLVPAVDACRADGTPWNLVTRCRTTSGKRFWARSNGLAVRDGTGTIVALEGSFQDITPERDALLAQEMAEDDLASVLGTMPDGFFLLDESWRFAYLNAASEAMLQRDPQDLVGRDIWQAFPEARGSRFEDVYMRVMARGGSESFTAFFPPLDAWFRVAAHRTPRGVAVHFRIVTAEIQEREELRRFRAALEALDVGAFMLSLDAADPVGGSRIVYANPVARAMAVAHDWAGSLPEILGPLESDPPLDIALAQLAEGQPCASVAIRGTGAGLRRFEVNAVPIRSAEDCPPRHAIVLVSDVTEARRLQEEQRRTERLALLGQMAGGVSHDFNNLLSVILGNVELIELTDAPTERAELVEEARAAVRRGQSLNDSLLAFSGRSRLEPRTEDLGQFIKALAPLLARTLTSRIALSVEVEPDLPQVLLDGAMAESCLLNLVINAREAIERSGAVSIALRRADDVLSPLQKPGPWVRLSVSDTGCGIPGQLHERVFEPFFSTRGPALGSGLGLSRVKGFAEQMGGFVTLTSEEGRGTEVAMHFPVAALQVPADEAAPAPAQRMVRALIVDDTPTVARVAARMLRVQGCRTHTVHGPREARGAMAELGPFDLLLTDMVMPHESGFDLALELRKAHPALKVILMSGFPQQDMGGALPEGMVFLRKPVGRDDLAGAFDSLGLGGPDLGR